MALQFLRRAQQLKILDAADQAVAVVRSPAFARFRPALAGVGFDVDAFARDLSAAALLGREAYTARGSSQDQQRAEATDVRRLVEDFATWVRTLQAATRALEILDHPRARGIARELDLAAFSGGGVEEVHARGPTLLRTLEGLGDLTALGIPPAFVAQGRALVEALPAERAEVLDHELDGQLSTAGLHAHLDTLVDLLDRYERFRAFAEAMTDTPIPGLGLAAVRARASGRPADDGVGPADAGDDAPPSDT